MFRFIVILPNPFFAAHTEGPVLHPFFNACAAISSCARRHIEVLRLLLYFFSVAEKL